MSTNLNDMSVAELQDTLTDVINAREAYPDNSLNKKALKLDEEYIRITDLIEGLKNLIEKIRVYVMNDAVRKENFTGVEICCEDDNEYANEEIREILDAYTWNKCKDYLNGEGIDMIDFIVA